MPADSYCQQVGGLFQDTHGAYRMKELLEPFVHGVSMKGLKIGARVMPMPWPKVFEGDEPALQLCRYMIRKGRRNVLLITSKTPVKTGLVQPLIDELESAGVTVTVHDETRPDPTIDQIEDVVSLLQARGCDSILVLGGGSCIDAAKVIAARAKNPKKSILDMTGMFRVTRGMLPLYAIPTTAGTGSEVSIGAVVTDPVARRKLPLMDPRMLPRGAALDGSLMLGVPPAMTAATGMDALTHAVEAFVSKNALKRTDALAMEATQLIMANLADVVADGQNLPGRQKMARASYLAGKAFTQVGVGYVHGIAHNFGAMYHLPHGRANAIIMPYVLEYSLPKCAGRLAKLATACGISTREDDKMSAARAFIQRIRDMNRDFGIPEKVDDLKAEDIPVIARNAREEARFTYAVPRYMNQAACEKLVAQMLP